MALLNIKFLLDENIPIKLKNLFVKLGIDCNSVQNLKLKGIKDKDLSKRIVDMNFILVTRDKDFTFFWNQRNLRIIYIAIEPAILEKIQPKVEEVLTNWNYPTNVPFLLIIQPDSVRFWKSEKKLK